MPVQLSPEKNVSPFVQALPCPSMGARQTVVFLTFSVLAQGVGDTRGVLWGNRPKPATVSIIRF